MYAWSAAGIFEVNFKEVNAPLPMVHFWTGFTVIVALQLVCCELPSTVRVYVIVAAGETVCEPFTGSAPMPLSSEADAALALVHASVDEFPALMVEGLAEMEQDGGGGGFVTVTFAVYFAVLPLPLALRV